MTSALNLATCSYHEYRPDMGVCVQTSVGYPRFVKFAERPADGKVMAPHGLRDVDDLATFAPLYLANLDARGEEIESRLRFLAHEHAGQRLVLCCFENLTKAWCHRSLLAGWIEARGLGEVVELGKIPAPSLLDG